MSKIEYRNVKISDICTPARTDKTLTRAKAKLKSGPYPVYAATIGKAFAFISDYNNTENCLVVVNDGDAGNSYIVEDEKYTIGKHATGLIPKAGIDLVYLQMVATPKFVRIAKGYGLGNLPKADIMNVEIEIPLKNGKYDLDYQQELSEKYKRISEQRKLLTEKVYQLKNISVMIPLSDSWRWKEVKVTELFKPIGGEMLYSKTWAKDNLGNVPLYSGATTGEYARVNVADYEGEYLTWCIDGLAGYIMYHNEAFSITCHRGILIPTEKCVNIDLRYMKYMLEPIFRKRKKGREGDLGKNEYTSLKPIAIKKMKDTIAIPLKEDGSYDLEKQQMLAAKYDQIEEIKSKLFKRIIELTEIVVL